MKKTKSFLANIGKTIARSKWTARAIIAGAAAAPTSAFAAGEPIDLSAAGTTIAGYVAVGAGWALPVFVAGAGLTILIVSFKRVFRK